MRRGWDEGVPDASSAIYTITPRNENPDDAENRAGREVWKVFAVAVMSSIGNQFEQAQKLIKPTASELSVHFYRDQTYPRTRVVLEPGEMDLFMLMAHTEGHILPIQSIKDHIIIAGSVPEGQEIQGRADKPSSRFSRTEPLLDEEIDFMVSSINRAFGWVGMNDEIIIKKIEGNKVFYLLNPKLNLEHSVTSTSKQIHDEKTDTMRRIQASLDRPGPNYEQ